ncbi:hypothetical protein KJ855_00030 [Patescibacteria group bacterium]|nr:hypothetical protein [Patescibacteria group bacterium]
MINQFKTYLLAIFFALLILLPTLTHATNTNQSIASGITTIAADELRAPFPGGSTTKGSLAKYVQDFYIFSIWLIAGISIIMVVFGGYQMIVSSGNPEAINKGRNTIISALVSLALLVLAYTILRIISPQIVEGHSFGPLDPDTIDPETLLY